MDKKQTVQFHFFATEEEAEKIQKRMEEAGISNRCAYLRKMAIDGYFIRIDLADVRELVRLLRIYSNNMNQYAKKANETGSIYEEDIRELQKDHKELWDMMREILKKLSALEPDSRRS